MSTNNTKPLPRDKGGEALQEFPVLALSQSRTTSENATTSSVITVSPNTASLEVAAIGAPAVFKWIARGDTTASVISAAGTANYDHVIQSGQTRKFAIPQEVAGASQGSVVGINVQAGLYQRIAYKSIGVGSVLTAEF